MNKLTTVEPGQAHGRVAVVDIGSNTVRLVVYDVPTRLPIPMYNEKAQCALGRGLGASGKLNPQGVECALSSIKRFVGLAKAMGVEDLELVATAAVRDASDGPQFIADIFEATQQAVSVLSGEDEAKYAALGLLMGVPHADGLIGDLGGGSLDLVGLDNGVFNKSATYGFGHIRLSEISEGNPERARAIVFDELSKLAWLNDIRGRTLYAAGGSWRALARILIDQTNHPLHVVDNFSLPAKEVLKVLHVISTAGPNSLEKIPGVPSKRVETLPFAAAALESLLLVTEAAQLQFSGFGMREGVLLSCLPDELRHQDPLLAACKTMSERTGRFKVKGREMLEWMTPIFADESHDEYRLRYAACLLSDVGWNEHPDYRAEHSFIRVLRVPYAGLTHADRALLAATVYVRGNGNLDDELIRPILGLLDESQLSWIKVTGLALRLGHTISGSAPGVLSKTQLVVSHDQLLLCIAPDDRDTLLSEAVQRRLKTLGRALGLKGTVD